MPAAQRLEVEREEAIRAVKQEASLALQSLLQENQRLRGALLRNTQHSRGHGSASGSGRLSEGHS